MANSKPGASIDEIIHDELDEPNKLEYYKEVQTQIKDSAPQNESLLAESTIN